MFYVRWSRRLKQAIPRSIDRPVADVFCVTAKEIVEATANEHGVYAVDLRKIRSKAAGREMAVLFSVQIEKTIRGHDAAKPFLPPCTPKW